MESFIVGDMDKGQGELRRYMFAIELNGTIGTKSETKDEAETSDTYTWDPSNASTMFRKLPYSGAEGVDGAIQTLSIRRVILGPSAKLNEENWVIAEVTDPDGMDINFPIAHLTKGKESQTTVDLTFPSVRDARVKFTLVEGTGPVHVIGYHLFETFPNENQDDEFAEEEEEIEDEEVEDISVPTNGEEKVTTVAPAIRAKRRMANGENGNGDLISAKKMKTNEIEEAAMEEAGNGDAKP